MPAPPPLRSDLELADALRLAVGRLARRLRQQSLGGVTLSQRSVLVTLETQGALAMGDLARAENISAPSATGIVRRLEAKGLLRREPDPTDARSTLVEMTDDARRGLADSRRARSAFLATRISSLSVEERAALETAVAVLDRMTAG
jgi:DNA-binding MarR family transcriptional regulator